jgi:hypothetical protein
LTSAWVRIRHHYTSTLPLCPSLDVLTSIVSFTIIEIVEGAILR